MRELVVLTFVSLDGVMQAPGGPEEDPTGGFTHGGWVFGYSDELLGNVMLEQMGHPFDLLLGRRTYEIFAAYWPYAPEGDPIADSLNNAKKYVVSRKSINLNWKNSHLIREEAATKIKELKTQDGPEIQVHGSGNLIQTLLQHDLVDEFRLKIFPVILGSGKRLFAEGAVPAGLTLMDSNISPRGVIVASYARAGEVKVGSFGLDTPSEEEIARRERLKEEQA